MASADAAVKGLDVRVTRIERLLPELATKKDLAAAVKPLATKAEVAAVRDEIAEFRTEVRREIADVRGEIADVRGEIADVRGEMKSLAPRALLENVEKNLKFVLEVVVSHRKTSDEFQDEMRAKLEKLDRRVMRLEGRARLESTE